MFAGVLITLVVLSGCSQEFKGKGFKTDLKSYIDNSKTHTYAICKQKSWNGIQQMRIYGEDVGVDKEPLRERDLQLNPECGTGSDDDLCYECWYYEGVEEPMFEVHLKSGASEIPVCNGIVRRYFIDGVDNGCKDNMWRYFGHKAYFPYDKEKYATISACLSSSGEWKSLPNTCADSCEYAKGLNKDCEETKTFGCDCGPDQCWNINSCEANEATIGETSNKSTKDIPEDLIIRIINEGSYYPGYKFIEVYFKQLPDSNMIITLVSESGTYVPRKVEERKVMQIPAKKLEEILKVIEDNNFFFMAGQHFDDTDILDAGTTTTSLFMAGKEFSVSEYAGSGPDNLHKINDYLWNLV